MRIAGALIVAALSALLCLPDPVAARESAAETFQIDPVHSVVLFRIKHLGVGYYHGRFNDISGTFGVGEGATASISVKADSVDTNNDKRDGHLKSPDFLSAKEFPEITFVAESLAKGEGDVVEAKGTLTLRGVSKPLSVPMTHVGTGKGMQGETRAGFEGTFTIKRADFGVSWGPQALGEEITITVAIEGVKQ